MPRKSKKEKELEKIAGAMNVAGKISKEDLAPSGGALHVAGNMMSKMEDKIEKASGGAQNIAGAMNVAGSQDIGGAMNVAGNYDDVGGRHGHHDKSLAEAGLDPDKLKNRAARHFWMNIDEMDNAKFYHWVLDLNAKQWEAIREAANQILGGAASSMWDKMDDEDKGGGLHSGMHHYRDILLTPNKGAAARLLELEHDAKGSGFGKALRHAVKVGRNIARKVGNTLDKGIPEAARIGSKVLKGLEKGADVVAKVGEPLSAVPGLADIAGPVTGIAKAASKGLHAADPLIEKARQLGEKKSGLKEIEKAAKNIHGNPEKFAKDLTDISNAVKEPGKLGDKVLSGISAASKAVANQEQPQQGAGPPAMESDTNKAGGFRKSAMMDPRKGCR